MQYCNSAILHLQKKYCNTAILQYFLQKGNLFFTSLIVHILKIFRELLKNLSAQILGRDFNRLLTEFWWYLQTYLNFSNFPIQFYIWKYQKTMSFFEVLHFNTSWLFAILQYCNTTFLKSNAILQKSRKSIAILKCNTAILQYWKSALS